MSLERVLEAEVMESIQEACDYDEMDHSAVNQLFVDDLLVQRGIQGEVLDIGVGTAQIPIEHRQQFVDSIHGIIEADGEVAPEEQENLDLLEKLLE